MWRSGDTASGSDTPFCESSQPIVTGFNGQLNPYVPGESFEDYLEVANKFYALNRYQSDEELVRLLIS